MCFDDRYHASKMERDTCHKAYSSCMLFARKITLKQYRAFYDQEVSMIATTVTVMLTDLDRTQIPTYDPKLAKYPRPPLTITRN